MTIVKELKPGSEAVDDEDLAADLRRRLMLIYHPVGTCRMSDTDENAVVDSKLRVHGIEGLRVADASIMPGGNTERRLGGPSKSLRATRMRPGSALPGHRRRRIVAGWRCAMAGCLGVISPSWGLTAL